MRGILTRTLAALALGVALVAGIGAATSAAHHQPAKVAASSYSPADWWL